MQTHEPDFRPLPVYSLSKTGVDPEALRAFFLGDTFRTMEGRTGFTRFRAESRHLDVDARTGWIWMSDNASQWSRNARPGDLVPIDHALESANAFLGQVTVGAASTGTGAFVDKKVVPRNGWLARFVRKTKKRTDVPHSWEFRSTKSVVVEAVNGDSVELPIMGGFGTSGVTVGLGGGVSGYWQSWQTPEDVAHYPLVAKEETDAIVRESVPNFAGSIDAGLAYEVMTDAEGARFLVPVRLYRPMVSVSGQGGAVRAFGVPAVRWALERFRLAGLVAQTTPCARPNASEATAAAAAVWIQALGDITGTARNAQAFLDGLPPLTWSKAFSCGDGDASRAQWLDEARDWIEAVDFLFYAGHATASTWQLKDYWLSNRELIRQPIGEGRLKWLALAACGPLWDSVTVSRGGNAFLRWAETFGGLRMLLGYGTTSFAGKSEGQQLMEFAADPAEALVSAWFRAAVANQPSRINGQRVWAGVMYSAHGGIETPYHDAPFAPGVAIAPDPPVQPDEFEAMWIPM